MSIKDYVTPEGLAEIRANYASIRQSMEHLSDTQIRDLALLNIGYAALMKRLVPHMHDMVILAAIEILPESVQTRIASNEMRAAVDHYLEGARG